MILLSEEESNEEEEKLEKIKKEFESKYEYNAKKMKEMDENIVNDQLAYEKAANEIYALENENKTLKAELDVII